MRKLTVLLLIALSLTACNAPHRGLEQALDKALEGHAAKVGIAIRTPEGGLILRNDTLLPMMSVFKFPAALAALDRAERDGTSLATKVRVGPEWLDAGTYSPMRDSLPSEGGEVTFADLLRYSVSLSDNIACDLLLDYAGGPAAVDEYVRGLGIEDIHIEASERTMHLAVENQRLNAARPAAVCHLFARLLQGGLLSPGHEVLLRRLLENSATGADKLWAGLPANVRLGHKTGSSDRTPEGIWIADNDAGYVTLPDGRTYCITVFVAESREDSAANAAIIAAVSRAAYHYFTSNPHP